MVMGVPRCVRACACVDVCVSVKRNSPRCTIISVIVVLIGELDLYSHTMLKILTPVRSPKLSNVG